MWTSSGIILFISEVFRSTSPRDLFSASRGPSRQVEGERG